MAAIKSMKLSVFAVVQAAIDMMFEAPLVGRNQDPNEEKIALAMNAPIPACVIQLIALPETNNVANRDDE